jgi:hypothetical protein
MILLDQATKAAATALLPAFDGGDGLFSLGFLLHPEPDDTRSLVVGTGLAFYAYAWSLNLPKPVLCAWTAGGLSNLLELWANGAVVDFVGISNGADAFTVFNVADVIIVVGFVALLGYTVAGKVRATDFMVGSAFLRPEDWGWNGKSKEENEISQDG